MKKTVFTLICSLFGGHLFAQQPFTGQDINPRQGIFGDDWSSLDPNNYMLNWFALSIYRDGTGSPNQKPYPGFYIHTPDGGFQMGICMDSGQPWGVGNFYMKANRNGGTGPRTAIYDLVGGYPSFFRFGVASTNFKALVINDNDRVGIGTDNMPTTMPSTNDNYRLFVKGGIKAEELLVELSSTGGWGDYVFDKNYELMELPALKTYVESNKHLPDFPSAQELVDNGGIEISKMIKSQQVKIEESVLYVLQLSEKLEKLQKQNEELQHKVESLEKSLSEKK